MRTGAIIVNVQVDMHGALESNRFSVLRRTVALWCLAIAQWLLQSRIDIEFKTS
jgi:hypothetical protein